MHNVLYSRVLKKAAGSSIKNAKIYLCAENNGFSIFLREGENGHLIGFFDLCEENQAHEFAYKMGEFTVDEIMDSPWSGIHVYSPDLKQTADTEGEEWRDA